MGVGVTGAVGGNAEGKDHDTTTVVIARPGGFLGHAELCWHARSLSFVVRVISHVNRP